MIMREVGGVEVATHGFACDADTVSRFREFDRRMRRRGDGAGLRGELEAAFGGTYMHYYAFQEVPEVQGRARIHYDVGNTLRSQGEIDLAVAHYRHALRHDPLYVDAQVEFGHALVSAGRLEEAAAHYREALRLKADSAEAREGLDRIKARATDEGGSR